MERKWLRAMLLGVSLALLLAGGVALAQMTLTVDQDCFECWPGTTSPDEEHLLVVTLDDYADAEADLCESLEINGAVYLEPPCLPGENLPEPRCEAWLWVDCQHMWLHIDDTCYVPDALTAGWPPVEYGDWVWRWWQEDEGGTVVAGPVFANFTFAEVCEEEVEFVPEPGTIALLGSGLAGLAGYAALRWRARS